MSIRSELNKVNLNRLADNLSAVPVGEALTLLIAQMDSTESGITPEPASSDEATDVLTLNAVPSALLQVKATAGTVTGVFTLRKGLATDVPATGECIWEQGTKKVAFNPADEVTQVDVTYVVAGDKASVLEGALPDGA